LSAFKIQIYSQDGVQSESLEKDKIVIGRSKDADLSLAFDGISREHLHVTKKGNDIWLVDNNSANGTFVDGKRIRPNEPNKYRQNVPIKLGNGKEVVTIEIVDGEGDVAKREAKERALKLVSNNSDLEDKKQELEKQKNELEQSIEELRKGKMAEAQEIVLRAQQEAENLNKLAISDSEKILKDAQEEFAQLSRELTSKTENLAANKKALQEIDSALTQKKSELSELQARLELASKDMANKEKNFSLAWEEFESKLRIKNGEYESVVAEKRLLATRLNLELETQKSNLLEINNVLLISEKKRNILEQEIAETSLRLENLRSAETALRKSNVDYEKRNGILLKEVERAESAAHEVEKKKDKNDAELHLLMESLSNKKKELQRLEQDVAEKNKNQEVEYRKIDAETSSYEAEAKLKMMAIDTQINSLAEQKSTLQKEINDLIVEQSGKNIEYNQLKQQWAIKAKQYEELSLQNEGKAAEANKLQKEITEQEELRARLNEEINRLSIIKKKNIEEIETQKGDALRGLQLELKNIEEQRLEHQKELDLMREEKKRANEEKDRCLLDVNDLKSEYQTLQNIINNMQQMQSRALENNKKQKEELIASLQELSPDAKGVILARDNKRIVEAEVLKLEEKKALLQSEITSFENQKTLALEKIEIIKKQEIEKGQAAANEIISAAKKDAHEIVLKASTSKIGTLESLQVEAQKIINDAKEVAKKVIERGEQEYRDRKRLEDQRFNEESVKRLGDLREKEEQMEKKIQRRRKDEVESISLALSKVINARFREMLGQSNKEKYIEALSSEVKDIVRSVLGGENPDVDRQTKQAVAYNPETAERMKKYWKRVGIALAVPVLLILINFIFPSFYPTLNSELSSWFKQGKTANDIMLEQFNETQANRPKFNPKQTSNYKESYTDNVLYTENFIAIMTDEAYQNRWVVELNKFIVNDLDSSDDIIVTFITLESGLIKELGELRMQINPEFEEEGIAKLREAEARIDLQFNELFRNNEEYIKFKEFRQKFFDDFAREYKFPAK